MKRLVETGAGRMERDVRKVKIGGLSVTVSAFDGDGWERAAHVWGERWNEDETLAGAIEKTASVPRDEAERIAAETVQQWKTRGGEDEDRDSREVIAYLATTFGLAALGLGALIVLVVWLVT